MPVAGAAEGFSPYSTVINYFCKWQASDVSDRMMDAFRDLARAEAGRQVEPTAAIIDTQSVKTAAVYVEKLFVDSGYAGPKLQDTLKELGVSELIEIVLKPKGGVHDCRIASGRIHFHQGLPPNVVLSALNTPVNLVAVDSSSNCPCSVAPSRRGPPVLSRRLENRPYQNP